jgi:hypothetical protein
MRARNERNEDLSLRFGDDLEPRAFFPTGCDFTWELFEISLIHQLTGPILFRCPSKLFRNSRCDAGREFAAERLGICLQCYPSVTPFISHLMPLDPGTGIARTT